MMMSLFSVFDPITYGGQINWISLLLPMMIFSSFYLYGGMVIQGLKMLFHSMVMVFSLLGWPNGKGIVLLVSAVFMYLCVENVMGLFPFIFTATAHPLITLGFGFVGWFLCFLMGWCKGFIMSAAHLVPEGCPLGLSFLLVIIESVSHLIRPFTLSIRLAANMMAGHLIVGLISKISMVGVSGGLVSVVLQTVMMLLESGVAVVQALVFSILLLLYIVEYY